MRAPGQWAGVMVAALLAALACFSERQDPVAAGPEGVCRIPVGSQVVGSVQVVVAIRQFVYLPDTLRISRGTTVTWVNCEEDFANEPHTATDEAGGWSSQELSPTDLYSRRFDTPGVFRYFCEPHPFMHGVLIVE